MLKLDAIFAIECELAECPFCLYGELPSDADIPLRACVKHLDIIKFVLDKAEIPVASGEF